MANALPDWPIPQRRLQIEARAKSLGLDIQRYCLIPNERQPELDWDIIWIDHKSEVLQISIDAEIDSLPIEIYSDDSFDYRSEELRSINAYRIRYPSLDAVDDMQIIEIVRAFISGKRDALHAMLLQLDPNFEFHDYGTQKL